ncbi:MAG: hypothetical protein GXP06_01790 [Alphaproteobacteria bacterium]|nr:hypothetical protein [Alphaproteobacteria bacterium]
MANITVNNILFSDVPLDIERDDHTLYIPPQFIADRDQVLGWFMGVWSGLEQTLLVAVHSLLDGPYSKAGVVFSNCNGVAQISELLNGLGELVLTKSEIDQLHGLTERLRRQNTKRNRIVHGAWVPEMVIGGDAKGRPELKSVTWVRIYSPTSPSEKAKTLSKNSKKSKLKYDFTVSDVKEVGQTVEKLRNDFNNFTASIQKRLHPEGLNMR